MFGETVVLKPGPIFDSNDDPIVDTSIPPVPLSGCILEPLGGAELVERGRNGAADGFRVFVSGPISRPVLHTDVLEIRGLDYPVAETPNAWVDPETGTATGTTIVAIRRKG